MSATEAVERNSEAQTEPAGSTSVRIIRVTNPGAVDLPGFADLVERAFKNHPFTLVEEVMADLPEKIADPKSAVFVARKDDRWCGFAMVQLGKRLASFQHFYVDRTPKVREALVRAIVLFSKGNGYTKAIAVDMNNKPRSFRVLFKSAGPGREVGRAYEFDLTGSRYE